MKKRILITGGAGFMGTNTAIYFYKKNWKIYIIDDCSRSGTKSNLNNLKKKIKYNFYKINVSNYKKVSKIISIIKPNMLLHCAGQVAVTKSIQNPKKDFDSNVIGTFNVLESVRLYSNKTKLIYISTNKVYGNINKNLFSNKKRYFSKKTNKTIDENYPLDFYSPYGCSKGSADQYVRDYSRIYKLNTIVLRLSCVYGIMQFGIEDHGWISWLSIVSYFNKTIKIFGNGKQVRDVLFIDDLVNLFYKIYKIKKLKHNIYNVGGGIKNSLSIIELKDELEKILNKKIKYKKFNWRQGDQKIYISNIERIKKDTGWYPKTKFSQGLNKLIKWIKFNDSIIKKTLRI